MCDANDEHTGGIHKLYCQAFRLVDLSYVWGPLRKAAANSHHLHYISGCPNSSLGALNIISDASNVNFCVKHTYYLVAELLGKLVLAYSVSVWTNTYLINPNGQVNVT